MVPLHERAKLLPRKCTFLRKMFMIFYNVIEVQQSFGLFIVIIIIVLMAMYDC